MVKRLLSILCIALAPLTTFADGISDATVYAPVTVLAASVDEAVPFFVVYFSDLDSTFHAEVTAEGTESIRVTLDDGTTEVAFYIASYSGGVGALFVEGSSMSASVDVDYRIYAGSPTAAAYAVTDTYGRNAVFAAYSGAWLPGMTTADLTGANNLTAVASPTTAVSGLEGITAAVYNGTSQYHYATAATTNWPITVELWASADSNTITRTAAAVGDTSGSSSQDNIRLVFAGAVSGDPLRAAAEGDPGALISVVDTAGSYTATTLHYAFASRTAATGTTTVRLDAGTAATDATTIDNASFNTVGIGAQPGTTWANFHDGNVALMLVSGSVRSSNYGDTMHDNLATGLYSAGASVELGGSCTSGSTGWVLFQVAAQATSANADWANLNDILVDDANTADTTLDEITNVYSEIITLDDIDYGTTVPDNADSYTVELRIKRNAQTSSAKDVRDYLVRWIDESGTPTGDNVAKTSTQWPSSATSTDYVFTGATYSGTFDADNGVQIQATGDNTNGNTTTEISVVWVKITWDCGDDPTANARGFFSIAK